MNNEPDDDQDLQRTLVQTLNSSLDRLDADATSQLMAARHAALLKRQTVRRGAIGLAVAATVAALAIIPLIENRGGVNPDATAKDDADYLAADPQMLSDMEMLSDMDMIDAMGEVAATTAQDDHANDS